MSGLHITGPADLNAHAITVSADNSTMTINSGSSIRMGDVTLTEDKFAKMDAMLEFVERFVQEDERAKAKKRILK
jgi:hypothetical protein